MKLVVKQAAGTTLSIECELSHKVIEVKEIISKQVDVPAIQQRLIYSGKVLKDPETLESYNVKDGHTVHMVRGAPATPAPAPAPAAIPTPPPVAPGLGGANPMPNPFL